MTTITMTSPVAEATLCRLDTVRERRNQRLRDGYLLRQIPLAYSLARQYAGAYGTEEELVKIATLGLVRAVQQYDRTSPIPFAAFAEPMIVAELEKFVQASEEPLGVAAEQAAEADAAEDVIAEAVGRQSHVRDLAEFLHCDVDALVGGLLLAIEREPHLVPSSAAREQPQPEALRHLRHA